MPGVLVQRLPTDALRLELRGARLFWHNLEVFPHDRPSEGGRAFQGRDLYYDFRVLGYGFFRMFDLFNVLLNYLLELRGGGLPEATNLTTTSI